MKMIMTVAPQAAGKTTWANKFIEQPENWNFVNINRDEIRFQMYGRYENVDEAKVQIEQEFRVETNAYWGNNVIISDTNLNEKTRAHWEQVAAKLGMEVEYKYFDGVGLNELIRRNKNRDRKVPEHVIREAYNKYREMRMVPYVRPSEGYRAYMCDIDGTIATMNGRSPFDMTRVGEDKVNIPVANVIRSLDSAGFKIIIMTGRDQSAEQATRQWLYENRIIYLDINMRPVGNFEKDSIVKYDLFKQHVEPFYNVIGVFDDRDQVVAMWRKIGLTCFQVAQGKF